MTRRLALPHSLQITALPAVLALVLSGCTSTSPATKPPAGQSSPSTPDAPASGPPAPTSAATATAIVVELDGQDISGELNSSATSASLIAQLPLTLSLRDFGDQEKVAGLPTPLDLEGAPEASAAPALTIGYYAPDQRLILYYDDVGTYAGIVPLGTYEDTVGIRDLPDGTIVTLRNAG